MSPVTLRPSGTAKFLCLLYPYSLAIILFPAIGGYALHALGGAAATAGVAIGLVGGIAAVGYGRQRLKRTYLTLERDALTLSNGREDVLSIPWSDVEGVDRRWKPFGLLTPRGMLLRIVPRMGSGTGPQYVYASWQATGRARRSVMSALTELSATHGFALDPSLGSGFGFTRTAQERG